MNIGLVTRWNVPCGVAVHGELIGRAWVEMGHRVKVFAPSEKIDPYIAPDEPYVIRCYNRDEEGSQFDDEKPFFQDDFDVFVIETMAMPHKQLMRIYPKIRERAKTIFVIHDEWLDKNLAGLQPDAVVCFDERFKRFLLAGIPEERIHIIPYPCQTINHGSKSEARQRLGLPLEKRIIFNFGIGVFRHIHLLPPLERLVRRYPFTLLTVTWLQDWFDLFSALKAQYPFIEVRQESLPMELLYSYLHACDVLLIHKDSSRGPSISSTVYQCLGSGCPILVHDVNFFETLGGEVLKYQSFEELCEKIEAIFQGKQEVMRTIQTAEAYAKANSGREIGQRFLALFESLL